MASRKPIRHGAQGGSICAVGDKLLAASPHKAYTHFMARGIRLAANTAPELCGVERGLRARSRCRTRPRPPHLRDKDGERGSPCTRRGAKVHRIGPEGAREFIDCRANRKLTPH